jgi:copper chaperone CopZ
MKTLALLLSALALVATPALRAADASTYEGTITGVVCIACKQHVTEALTSKLEGITEVKITPSDKDGEQKITIVSKKGDLTKDSAVQALGKLSEDYQILSLAKKG